MANDVEDHPTVECLRSQEQHSYQVDFLAGIGFFERFKSRLVGGVIVWLWPYFTVLYGLVTFCPPICPPIEALRNTSLVRSKVRAFQ